MKIAQRTRLKLKRNPNFNDKVPEHKKDEIRPNEDIFGTWGGNIPRQNITIFTDGSLQKEKGKAGWGYVVCNNWFLSNWGRIHESKHRAVRRQLIHKHMEKRGGGNKQGYFEFHNRASSNNKSSYADTK